MSEAADRAYEAARRAIARAKAEGADELELRGEAFRALDRPPPEIEGLDGLKTLNLRQTQVADIAPLAALTGLQTLYLSETQVADIAPLAALTGLQSLNLNLTQVADIAPLAALTGLQGLGLSRTQVAEIAPLAALTGLQTLYLSQTQVADIAPLAALAGLRILDLNRTQVADIAPLAALEGLQSLGLSQTQVADIAPLAALTGLQFLDLDQTQVGDLRPLAGLRKLGDGHFSGLWFKDTAATAQDAELARLAEIEDNKQRTKETLAYLRALPPWPEPYTPAARSDGKPPQPIGGPTIPAPSPAPLEVEERDGQLRQIPPSDGLILEARDPARDGWEALVEALEDLAHLRPRLGNQMPGMARALARFEAALGESYAQVRPIKLGAHGNRVMALADTAEETLQPADAAELRELAAAIALFMERFPDWVTYRDAARANPPDAAKVEEALPLLQEIAEQLRGKNSIHPEIPDSLKEQTEAVKDAPDDPVAADGLMRSQRNVLLGLAERVKGWGGRARDEGKLIRDEGKKMAAKELILAGLDLFATAAGALRGLAANNPQLFGWLLNFLRYLGL